MLFVYSLGSEFLHVVQESEKAAGNKAMYVLLMIYCGRGGPEAVHTCNITWKMPVQHHMQYSGSG